jgi:hypothetical protein
MSSVEFVELRVVYPGYPYVALITGVDRKYGLRREFMNELYDRRERLEDGTQFQIFRLPTYKSAVFEVQELVNGRKQRRYVAVLKGHPQLYQVSLSLTELVAAGKLSVEAAIQRFESGETADTLWGGRMEIEEV